jgi:hypothetical protein
VHGGLRSAAMGSSRGHRRPGTALVVAYLVLGPLLLAPAACGGGNGTARPSGGASVTRTRSTAAQSPEAPASRSARPDRTVATAAAPTAAPTAAPAPSRTPERVPTTPPASAVAVPPPAPVPVQTVPPTSAAPPTPVAATTSAASKGLGALGWTLLIALVALLIGGLVMWRSRQGSAWDAEADTLDAATRNDLATRLPPVLTAEAADQRALTWPPVRADLADLTARWDLLVQSASGEPRRNRALQIRGLLRDLVAAVDAENQALAGGQDWTLLRPRVDAALQALSTALAGQPRAGAHSR